MAIITHAELRFNQFTVTLIFGTLSPPARQTTEKAMPDRIKHRMA